MQISHHLLPSQRAGTPPPLLSNSDSTMLHVLGLDAGTSTLSLQHRFLELLQNDEDNARLNIITFIGSKQKGKSLLVDLLVSRELKKETRAAISAGQPFISMPLVDFKSRNGQQLFYMDCHSTCDDEVFIWSYFLSSLLILNLDFEDANGESGFLQNLAFLKGHFEAAEDQLTKPELVVVRRNCPIGTQVNQKEFLQKVQFFEAFAGSIRTFQMPSPPANVARKQIKTIPQSGFGPQFRACLSQLLARIKASSNKSIYGHAFTTRMVGLISTPLLEALNAHGSLRVEDCWQSVIGVLSASYSIFYIESFNSQIEKAFFDQKPCSKYELYKRLEGIKQRVKERVKGFSTIESDPIFIETNASLQRKLMHKEGLIRQVNLLKSRAVCAQEVEIIAKLQNQSEMYEKISHYNTMDLDQGDEGPLLVMCRTAVQAAKNDPDSLEKQLNSQRKQLQQIDRNMQEERQGLVKLIPSIKTQIEELKKTLSTKKAQLGKAQSNLPNSSLLNKVLSPEAILTNTKIGDTKAKIQQLRSNLGSKQPSMSASLGQKDLTLEEEKITKEIGAAKAELASALQKYNQLKPKAAQPLSIVQSKKELPAVAPSVDKSKTDKRCCELM